MKVAVNIHCMHPPLTGIGHYARHLLEDLLADPAVESVLGVSHAGWHTQEEVAAIVAHPRGYEFPTTTESGELRPKPSLARRVLRRVPGVGRLRARVSYLRQQRQTRGNAGHIYWEPNYLLLPLANPALTTVYDLSHLRHPEYHPRERIQELQRLPASLQRARHIVTISDFTRRELAEIYAIDPAKVTLVAPAVSERFKPRGREDCAEVLARYQLPENYVLYTGTIEPRKNLPRLIQAYAALPQALQRQFPLVLAGGEGWHFDEFLAALAKLDARHIVRLGYVSNADLPAIYSRATVFAYPSLYEGFGMPVLEAMASGVPVLTSNVASMPEVAAGAALLVAPESVAEISAGLQTMLEDPLRRDAMVAAGLLVAARYSWQNSYAQLRLALQAAAA